jgi:hypothetical protein
MAYRRAGAGARSVSVSVPVTVAVGRAAVRRRTRDPELTGCGVLVCVKRVPMVGGKVR